MSRSPRCRNAALVAAMARAGLTSAALAERAAVHRNTISRLLNRRGGLTLETAYRVAAALAVPMLALQLLDGSRRGGGRR